MFPAYGSMTRRPASLHRVLTGRVPLLRWYYQGATTPCRSSRRTSFPSFGGTADGRLRFRSHRRQATNTCDAGLIGHPGRPPIPGVRAETTGPPTFLGNPDCAYALLFDPGRTDHTRPFSVRRLGPRSDHDEGSCGNCLSRLYHTAWALAVYASQDGSLHHHARLASGCRPSSTGRAWYP